MKNKQILTHDDFLLISLSLYLTAKLWKGDSCWNISDGARGSVHMETLLCVNAHVLRRPRVLVRTVNLRTLRIDDLQPPTSSPCDYTLVFMLQKISSVSGLLGQNILLLCCYAEQKRLMDNIHHIIFFFLCSVSSSTVCLCTVCKLYTQAPSLRLHFWWISSATYRPGIWTTACWVVYNWSVLMQIFLKRCRGRRGGKRSFWFVWTWPEWWFVRIWQKCVKSTSRLLKKKQKRLQRLLQYWRCHISFVPFSFKWKEREILIILVVEQVYQPRLK